jgi:hypothetical protein
LVYKKRNQSLAMKAKLYLQTGKIWSMGWSMLQAVPVRERKKDDRMYNAFSDNMALYQVALTEVTGVLFG